MTNERAGDAGDDRLEVTEVRVTETDVAGAEEDTTIIRAEIRETRERLGDTLEEIGSRLNPTHLKNQAAQEIREATIGRVEHMAQRTADRVSETGQGIMDTIRDNPIPAAMVGIGLGWLLWNGRRGDRSSDGSRASARPWHAGGNRYTGASYAGGYSGGYPGAYGNRTYDDRAADRFSERDTGDAGALDTLRTRAGDLADRAQEATGQLVDRTQHVAGTVADEARQQARRVEDLFHENPLALGAATLAAGVMVGLAVPETRRERELMGEARDRLADRARDAAEDAGERVQRVAGRVLDEAKSTAAEASRAEGLTA